METRSQMNRLKQHEEHIQRLQSDIQEIKVGMQAWESERAEEAEFRKMLMASVKQQGVQPNLESGGPSGASNGSSIPHNSQGMSPPLQGDSSLSSGPRWGSSDMLPWAAKKVKLPEFYGFDPQGWIQKAELYFDIHDLRVPYVGTIVRRTSPTIFGIRDS
ncbi:uncharacterized protein LOC112510537 [Cynara cardunculus var. scolymus]|uniref:uncharacterized protein LOC112510537 n=1 Tax=Cynara cardunculus var. scolymus TaxID=59895 RepID=UPI000D62C4B2|nr:uncharacterized protein LOC112510537 [Cynara cardunculus var. scolymus]